MEHTPRVLVISHNVFSRSGNMGRTMADLLSCVPPENLAQLYFHSEVPTMDVCGRYFRITDKNVLRSVVTRKSGYRVYGQEDIQPERATSRTDSGVTAQVYQFSRRRTPLIYLARNTMWKMGKWKSPELESWLREFDPEVIFFASGDYVFPYRIVCDLADRLGIPVVMWCCDDYYIGKKNIHSPLYPYTRRHLMKWARQTAERSKCIVTICDKMRADYGRLFKKRAEVIRISAQPNPHVVPKEERAGIVYAGNLGLNRIEPLLELANALKEAGVPGYDRIDVYSGEGDPEKLARLTEENGIRFHGTVPNEELKQLLGRAKYLLHVEAFDENSRVRTRYSLSTKIGESLQSGGVTLCYAPADIASVEYLRQHDAAVILERAEELPGILRELNEKAESYDAIVARAAELARKCHDKEANDRKMLEILTV